MHVDDKTRGVVASSGCGKESRKKIERRWREIIIARDKMSQTKSTINLFKTHFFHFHPPTSFASVLHEAGVDWIGRMARFSARDDEIEDVALPPHRTPSRCRRKGAHARPHFVALSIFLQLGVKKTVNHRRAWKISILIQPSVEVNIKVDRRQCLISRRTFSRGRGSASRFTPPL